MFQCDLTFMNFIIFGDKMLLNCLSRTNGSRSYFIVFHLEVIRSVKERLKLVSGLPRSPTPTPATSRFRSLASQGETPGGTRAALRRGRKVRQISIDRYTG